MAKPEAPKHIVAKLLCSATFFIFALTWYALGLIPAAVAGGASLLIASSVLIMRAKTKAVRSVDGEQAGPGASQIDAMREIWLKKYGYICKEGSVGHNIIKFLLTSEKTRTYFVTSEVKWLSDSNSLMAPYSVIRVRTKRDEGRDVLESEEIPNLIKQIAAGIYKYAPVTYLTYDTILKEQKVAFPFFFIFYTQRPFTTADGHTFTGVDKEVTISVEALMKVDQGFCLAQLHRLARVDLSPGLPIRSDTMPFAERNTPGRFKVRAPGAAVDADQRQAMIEAASGACQGCGAKADEGALLEVVPVGADQGGSGGLKVLCATCRARIQAAASGQNEGRDEGQAETREAAPGREGPAPNR